MVMDAIHAEEIKANVQVVLEAIHNAAMRVGRNPKTVRLVAASKMVAVDQIHQAFNAGVNIFGENRLQEAQPKMAAIGETDGLTWHFIGRLQRRKIKAVIGAFELLHSLESLDQAREIDRRAAEANIQQPVLLEVNVGDEPSKGGFSSSSLREALPVLDAMPNLLVQGLMAIPPVTSMPDAARPYFRQLRLLADSIAQARPRRIRMDELSMGMSQDYPIAVEEGATLVRVGTAIFGARGN